MEDNIYSFTQKFFEKLMTELDSLNIVKENENIFLVKIESKDSAILIGHQGNTIESLQRILNLAINKSLGQEERIRVKLEINDYFKSKDEILFSFIDEKIKLLLENGGEYRLPKYSPYERKKIHSYIAKSNKGVKTKSKGEKEERRLFLIKEKGDKKLTIDIDGDNI